MFTNSTANRLRFSKGWKNASFPETLPFYSRDNVFFFKLYLFLKAYFTLKRTRLIYCDIRQTQNSKKLLYLVINSVPRRFRKKQSYSTWFLRKPHSSYRKSVFRTAPFVDAFNLAYLDLPKLRKILSARLLPLSKQKVNKIFYQKNRYKTWINFLAKLKSLRTTRQLQRKYLKFSAIPFHHLSLEQSLLFKVKRLKTEIVILNRFFKILKKNKALTKYNMQFYKCQLRKLKQKFNKINQQKIKSESKKTYKQYKVKLKEYSSSVASVKAKILISTSKLNRRLLRANKIINASTKISLNTYTNWYKRATVRRFKVAQFLLRAKEQKYSHFGIKYKKLFFKREAKSNIAHRVLPTIKQMQKKRFEIYGPKLKSKVFNDNGRKHLLARTVNAYSAHFKNSQPLYMNMPLEINNLLLQRKFRPSQNNLDFPKYLKRIYRIYHRRARRGNRSRITLAIFKKLRKHKRFATLGGKQRRFSRKSFAHVLYNSFEALLLDISSSFKSIASSKLAETSKEQQKLKIQKPIHLVPSFRSKYRDHTHTLIKYQYKLGLQRLLFKYFKMQFDVKITRPLTYFKNFKFLRLVYPLRVRKKILTKRRRAFKGISPKLTYSLPSRNYRWLKTQNIKLQLYKVVPLKLRYILLNHHSKRFVNRLRFYRKRPKSILLRNTRISKKKPNFFLRLRRKELLDFTQSRLFSARRHLIMRSFAPIASLFIKYLHPQILADHIAKEFEKTKYHKSIIYNLSTCLRSLPLRKAKGYRISIAGRINSSDKSRVFILKRNVLVRQNFSKNMNFAYAQARGRIGSFGIKVWVFY